MVKGQTFNRFKMKTINKIILGMALVSLYPSNQIKAKEHPTPKLPLLKVGDKMPDFYEGYSAFNFGSWNKNGKKGTFIRWDRKEVLVSLAPNNFYAGDRKPDYMEVKLICNGKIIKNPFGVKDFDLKTLYLDTNLDGYINKVKENSEEIVEYIPNCPI